MGCLQLNFLVDLKQKQNSVMDARESLKMTKETTRQGKTVLIFTLTTIIFVSVALAHGCGGHVSAKLTPWQLPLSFLASFFALDIKQFYTDDDGKLDLGYVSSILCESLSDA